MQSVIGLHVPLKDIDDYKVPIVQVFIQGPLSISDVKYDENTLKKSDKRIYVHSSYVISPWSNIALCKAQNTKAAKIGARSIVYHLPKKSIKEIVEPLKEFGKPSVKILLENRACRPDDILSFETPEKFNYLSKQLQMEIPNFSKYFGFAIDTAHLFASGIDLRSYENANEWLMCIKYPNLINLIHLNGSASDNFADKHATAFSKKDKIWHGQSYKDSGFRAFVEFANKHKIDIILENPTDEGLSFLQQILKIGKADF